MPLMRLELNGAEISALIVELEEIFSPGSRGGEFRLDLPERWILFWKRREGESRQLLARPEAEIWVATLALEAAHGLRVTEALRTAVPGSVVAVGRLSQAGLGSVSNVEVEIRVVS